MLQMSVLSCFTKHSAGTNFKGKTFWRYHTIQFWNFLNSLSGYTVRSRTHGTNVIDLIFIVTQQKKVRKNDS